MTNDSHLFRTREQLEADSWQLTGNAFVKGNETYLPLYEGKMISYFDHRFGTYDVPKQLLADNGKLPELSEQQHADPYLLPIPQYWIHKSHLPDLLFHDRNALLVFRGIARSADVRTATFCLVPAVPCGNSLSVITLDPREPRKLVYLGSCTSSFIFDYVARQKLGGTNMNYFILKQLPVLSPDEYTSRCAWDMHMQLGDWIWLRALELTYTAWDLESFAKDCGYNGPPFQWNEQRRFLLRCELDGAYFHLYHVERDAADYVMETFPIVKRKDEEQYGEYRTKRVVLEIYDKMKQAMDAGEPYQPLLHPSPADPSLAHPPRMGMKVRG